MGIVLAAPLCTVREFTETPQVLAKKTLGGEVHTVSLLLSYAEARA